MTDKKADGKEKGNFGRTLSTLFKKGDLILLAVVLILIALTVWFAVKKTSGYVEIYIDGTLKYQLDVNTDRELEILNGAMTVKVEGGRVWIEHSDCPEQLCVQSAPITSAGGMIVCLPNKVVVKISQREVDAIT